MWTEKVAALAVTVIATALWLGGPATAQATTYVFNPTLSLTGNCATSPLDEVPDPGPCPGTPGVDHPSEALKRPGVAIDDYGDIYVVNIFEKQARVDVFDSEGFFVTEFADPTGPQSIAVDSEGNVYLFERLPGGERMVRRFPAAVYEPLKGEIEYTKPPQVLVDESTKPLFNLAAFTSVEVDRSTNRVYVDNGQDVFIFKSAKEGNELLEAEVLDAPTPALAHSGAIAIDSKHKKIYVSDRGEVSGSIVRIFALDAPRAELGKITGSTTPKGQFLTGEGLLTVDVEESTGHVFVGDFAGAANKVYEFEEDGTYLATIEHHFDAPPFGEIAIDNGAFSAHPGYLFVPSGFESAGHVYAFEPKIEEKPDVDGISFTGVTETEAVLKATINPKGLETTYRFEYLTEQQFQEAGETFTGATLAGEGVLSKGGEGVAVSAAATELEPGTRYRFRALAENAEGSDEEAGTFTTFDVEPPVEPCPNDTLRIGFSALLPDCRAYELVTPADTNGRPPSAGFAGAYFPTLRAAPDGNRATFVIEGGLIPGSKGTGAFNGDSYLATRGSEGWTSQLAGPLGEEAGALKRPNPGGVSPDQTYSLWEDTDGIFIHYPDGHSELVGRGSLGEDPTVSANLLTEDAAHIIFSSSTHLEEAAPPSGTTAIYDRSLEGPTQVVSLLPGNVTPAAKDDAKYLSASEEGEGIAFSIAGSIYLRLHNEETFKVAGPGTAFAGVADEGNRVFYLEGGDLFAFDAEAEETIEFSSSGDITPVNVASGGTRAYFVSPSVLTSEPNPEGEKAKAGKENLYLSEEGTISFVGILTERDVEGENPGGTGRVGGLGLWQEALETARPAIDPSRATPTGATLLFESRADLTEFASGGFAQVYRYDSTQNRLTCLSCSPTGTPPSSDASLQSIAKEQFSPEPGRSFLRVPNQNPAGSRAFFQTAERLALGDTDNKLDVYEWEEEGIGSCEKPGGCVYLLSGGQSAGPDYLFGVSKSGDDVFFRSSDQLLARDTEATLSLYDARVGGGFPEPQPAPECEGEGCHSSTPSPTLSSPAKPAQGAKDQVVEGKKKHCPKGKHKAKRHGKTVCVKNHKKHHYKAGTKQNGGSR